MLEHQIVATIASSKNNLEIVKAHVSGKELSTIGKEVFSRIDKYYAKDPKVSSVDLSLLQETMLLDFPKERLEVTEYFNRLPENPSANNLINYIVDIKKHSLLKDVLLAAAKEQYGQVDDLIVAYTDLSQKGIQPVNGTIYHRELLSDALQQSSSENLIPIYPTKLSDLLGGGIPRQSQVGICARPDVGKSTIAINIAGGALLNGLKVLYVGNEDAESRMIARMVARTIDVPYPDIIANPAKYEEEAVLKGYHNFMFAGLYPGTLGEIRSLVDRFRPDMLVVDQIKNLHTKKESVENLEESAKGTRDIAKEFNLVSVIVTQAGESAQNKLVLEMGDVYMSNTGFQGTLDLLIGAGQNDDFKRNSRVFLSFPKNKLSAPIEPFVVNINYLTNKIMSIGQ